MAKVSLLFKATKFHRYHNEPDLQLLQDGDQCVVDEKKAKKLMADYPENFFRSEDVAKKIRKKSAAIKAAPDKAIKEAATKTKD